MTQAGEPDPIFTRRSFAAAIVVCALLLLITALQWARDGASGGRVALGVSFVAGVMVATGLVSYVLATWARRYRYTPREPIVVVVVVVSLMSVWLAFVYAFGMMLSDASPRRIFLTAGSVGAIMWVGSALASAVALRVRRRPSERP